MLDVVEDVFCGLRDDPGCSSSPVQKEAQDQHTVLHDHRRTRGRTPQSEGLPGHGLSACKPDRIVTLHGGDCAVPGGLVENRFDEFVEVEFGKGGAGGFFVLGVEFDGLGA